MSKLERRIIVWTLGLAAIGSVFGVGIAVDARSPEPLVIVTPSQTPYPGQIISSLP